MYDAAAMAAQSDPDRNPNFRRRWGPPPERKRPRTGDTAQRATFDGSSENDYSYSLHLLQAAFRLDRMADQELAVGRVAQAERLSQHAAELREGQA
jgi:hypothetical protein